MSLTFDLQTGRRIISPVWTKLSNASILVHQSLRVLHVLISNMIQKASDRAAVTQELVNIQQLQHCGLNFHFRSEKVCCPFLSAFPHVSIFSLNTAKVLKRKPAIVCGCKSFALLWLKCCPCGYCEEQCTSNIDECISAIFSRSVALLHKLIFKNGN